MKNARASLATAAMAGAAVVSACADRAPRPAAAPSTEAAAIAEDTRVVADVESVDRRTREVALRGHGGERVVVSAGPGVRNLAHLPCGDRVAVTYGDMLAGAAPRAGRRARVRIEAADPSTGHVAFVGPRRVVTPREPEMVDFARRLRPGEEAEVTYTEASAVRVEPASR